MILYLFDIDGTLLLSGGAGSIALDQVFERRYGLRGAMNQVNPGGKTDPMILAEVFEQHLARQPASDEIDAILADYVPCLRDALARATRFRLMPAVVEILDFLAEQPGVCLGLATGNIQAGAQAKLEHAGLWQRFAVGGFGDDSPDRAALVERAIARGEEHVGCTIAREHVIVVGDTWRDVQAAKACQARAVAVATGSTTRADLVACHPDVVFDTLAELPAWHRQVVAGSHVAT